MRNSINPLVFYLFFFLVIGSLIFSDYQQHRQVEVQAEKTEITIDMNRIINAKILNRLDFEYSSRCTINNRKFFSKFCSSKIFFTFNLHN